MKPPASKTLEALINAEMTTSPVFLLVIFLPSVSALILPAAASPVRPPPSASSLPPATTDRTLSPLEAALLAAFRWQTQQQTGVQHSEPGFHGMLQELRQYQREHTMREQADTSLRIMTALAGPFPAIFKPFAGEPWMPSLLAWFTTKLLSFLVGKSHLTQRRKGDTRGGGVLIERCAVLEHGGCKGLCVHMCKLPTERMFAEQWGLPLHMAPNFETCECQLSFGAVPPSVEEDESLPTGCLGSCPLARDGGPLAEN